jgi:hypothetical protein
VLRPEVVVVLGAGCAGLGAVVATLWGAATGEEDEHAAGASQANPTASTMLIARWHAGRRPRNVVERCCLAMSTLIPPMQLQATPGALRSSSTGPRLQAARQERPEASGTTTASGKKSTAGPPAVVIAGPGPTVRADRPGQRAAAVPCNASALYSPRTNPVGSLATGR